MLDDLPDLNMDDLEVPAAVGSLDVRPRLSQTNTGGMTALYHDISPSSRPTRNSLDGKVSGIDILAMDAPHGVSEIVGDAFITPGVFIRKDAVDTNYIGIIHENSRQTPQAYL